MDVCACKEQYPDASQQNIINYFSILWGKPTSQNCAGDTRINKKI
jgi:hypothetical protein